MLNKGITSLGFCLDKDKLTYNFIKTLLNGIYAPAVAINFSICACAAPKLANILVRYYGRMGYDTKGLIGSINVDPIKNMLLKGKALTREQVSEKIAETVKAAKSLPGYRVVGVNSVILNNSGAYAAQELAYALAWGAEYMTMMTEAGIPNYRAANAIRFNMGIGGNYFMEIAKFRAGRLLWAKIVEAYKDPIFTTALRNAAKMNVSAETSRFNMTVFDAYVNLLRSQTETMSAALAGVDEITVTPFDVTYEEPTDFSERIARNQQLLLKEEAHFDKVVDPAAGSYYLENLTASIAAEAWKQFLDIQERGGMYQLVSEGKVQEHMAANLKARLADVAKRKEVLLGSNQFPNFTEKAGKKIKISEKACCCKGACEPQIATLPVARAAEEFEALRLETEAAKKQPVAFMLILRVRSSVVTSSRAQDTRSSTTTVLLPSPKVSRLPARRKRTSSSSVRLTTSTPTSRRRHGRSCRARKSSSSLPVLRHAWRTSRSSASPTSSTSVATSSKPSNRLTNNFLKNNRYEAEF